MGWKAFVEKVLELCRLDRRASFFVERREEKRGQKKSRSIYTVFISLAIFRSMWKEQSSRETSDDLLPGGFKAIYEKSGILRGFYY